MEIFGLYIINDYCLIGIVCKNNNLVVATKNVAKHYKRHSLQISKMELVFAVRNGVSSTFENTIKTDYKDYYILDFGNLED